ncbi:replicative DNA helicase [Candidatus Babeliales bacterium]|nr:replicative DNA helicase [Candidatus Babeliales bacterium]MBP9844059.1 replicative DNA helicase [Candidatus Babeliales bacterium]
MSQATNQNHNNFYKKTTDPVKPVESMLGKSLPSNIDAERAILGAILLNDECYHGIADLLLAADFYMPAHRAIYQAIVTLASSNQRIDMITLQHQLEAQKEMDVAGGVIYLVGLQEDIPSVGLIEQHAQIVKSKSTLRSLINSSVGIITDCYNQTDKDIESIIDEAERRIFDVSTRTANKDFIQLDIWLRKTFQHLSSIKSSSKGVTGVSSSFEQLDNMTSGFQKGDLIILAARPSMGKTAFALNLSVNAAKNKMAVGFFSLEMSAEQLTLRLLSTESGISHQSIRNATISSEEWIELTHVAADLAQMKFFIDDTAGISIMELRAKARKLKAKHGVDLLVVDYLQLLHSSKKHENRHQEVSEISRSLKGLAKELGVPIIALSQLSRAVDSRVDKRPLLSDLRESGAIEQDADVIMFMYRDIVYNPETENPASAELIIGKQRNGPTGTVALQFIRELTKFESASQEY